MASLSATDICNMALSHLGISKEIANLNEQSKEAEACRRFYDITRQSVLKDHSWPFASKYATLALIEQNPNDEWTYAYRYPVDCLFLRRILSGLRNDTEASKIPYAISQDDAGYVILTNQDSAQVHYTIDVSESLFTSDFALALSYRLSHYMAPRLTAGDPYKLGAQSLQKYFVEVSRATANAFNEDASVQFQDTESILARNS